MHMSKCHDPRVIKQYTMILEQGIVQGHLLEQLFNLQQSVTCSQLTRGQQKELEDINQIGVQLKLQTKQDCCQLPAGAVGWCPKLSQAINQILYWKGMVKCISRGHIHAQTFRKLAIKASIEHSANSLL